MAGGPADVAGWVTVTNPVEAEAAEAVGADGLAVQGTEAGGHRGGWLSDGSDEAGFGLLALLRILAHATPLPLIATGGIADGAGLAAVLCAGASAGQIGTALMLAPKAGTAEAQRALLAAPAPGGRATRITRAFTGRPARGIVNRRRTAERPRASSASARSWVVEVPMAAGTDQPGRAVIVLLAQRDQGESADRSLSTDLV
jgi:nitronate monooxygenase